MIEELCICACVIHNDVFISMHVLHVGLHVFACIVSLHTRLPVCVCCVWLCMNFFLALNLSSSVCLPYCLFSVISSWTQNSYPRLPLHLLSMMTPINFHNHPFTLLYYRSSIFPVSPALSHLPLISSSSLQKIASMHIAAKPAQTSVQFFYMNISFTFLNFFLSCKQSSCKVRIGIWPNLWSSQTS